MTGARAIADSRDGSKPWLIAGAACALAATGALMLTEEARWLRLGIIAALWAALFGAFLATKYRRQAEHAWDSVADAEHIYELELEREITARREYELELEASTRRRVEQETQSELQNLRTEVMELRDSLQQLMGGEVFFERVALTEQSTRRRSTREEQNGVTTGDDGGRPHLAGGTATAHEEVADERTQVISRVITSNRPITNRNRPPFIDVPHEPQPEPAYEPYQQAPEPPRVEPQQPPERFAAQPLQLESVREKAAEQDDAQRFDDYGGSERYSASDFSLADYANGNGNGAGSSEPASHKYEFPAFSLFEDDAPNPFGSNGAGGNGEVNDYPGNDYGAEARGNGEVSGFGRNGHAAEIGVDGGQPSTKPTQPRQGRPHDDRADTGDLSALLADWRSQPGSSQPGSSHAAGSHAASSQPEPQQSEQHSWFAPFSPATPQDDEGGAYREPESAGNHSLPLGAREIQRQGRPGGRRRKPESEELPAAQAHHAAPGGDHDSGFPGTNGKHSHWDAQAQWPEPSPVAARRDAPGPPQRSVPAPEQSETTGSHASGRSVHDLLAAHGRGTPARRHRYRD